MEIKLWTCNNMENKSAHKSQTQSKIIYNKWNPWELKQKNKNQNLIESSLHEYLWCTSNTVLLKIMVFKTYL